MKAFHHSPLFAPSVQAGKQAIKSEHGRALRESRQHKCLHSLDFDGASTRLRLMPGSKRWDYFVETSAYPGQCLAVEVHPFKPSELIEKRQGTLAILGEHCPQARDEIRSWHVIVTSDIRSDLASRFSADTRIRLHRSLDLSKA